MYLESWYSRIVLRKSMKPSVLVDLSIVMMMSLVKLLTAPYKVTELCLTVFVCLLIGASAFIHVFLIALTAHKFVYNSKVVRMLMLS